MTAIAPATKSYFIGPSDGWTKIITGTTTNIAFIRISAYPHTHPIQVAVGSSAPDATISGITVCHHPFKVYDVTNLLNTNFYVKVNNPGNQGGKVRVDVYAEGGVLV